MIPTKLARHVAFLLFWLLQSLCNNNVSFVEALFADEVGTSDFLVATTGHGPTSFVHSSARHGTVITSDSPVAGHQLVASAPETSCFVASRRIDTGALQWRRNVCANADQTHHTTTVVSSKTTTTVCSMDSSGVIRAWDAEHGNLQWDAFLGPTTQPRILTSSDSIAAVADDKMVLLDVATGEMLSNPFSASQVLQDGSADKQAQWLQIVSEEGEQWKVLLGYASTNNEVVAVAGSDLVLAVLELQENGDLGVVQTERFNHITQMLDVSSLHVFGGSGSAMALSSDGRQAFSFGLSNGEINFDMANVSEDRSWSRLSVLTPVSGSDTVARIRGIDEQGIEQEALFQLPSWNPVLEQASSSVAHVTCGTTEVVVAVQNEQPTLQIWSGEGSLTAIKTSSNAPGNALQSPTATGLHCVDNMLDVLLSTSAGTTMSLQVDVSSKSATWKWTAEEGLGHVDTALLLDASHAVVVDDLVAEDSEQEPAEIARRLEFSARLSSQWESLVGAGANLMSSSTKDRLFGFLQIAVLVSKRTHRLYGMELAGSNRGSVSWTIDLPSQASWHKLVHGTHNSPKGTHGIQGGTHAREVLVVSAIPSSRMVDWKCVDGTNGEVHAEGVLEVASPILQIMPAVGGGSCRQQALLMLEDRSVAVIPDADSESTFANALKISPNGLFSHVLNDIASTARLESYQISSPTARLVGQTSFPGERLIQAVYPSRDEVVQSPCTVLGDDSLLLKYLNPHLVVLITVREDVGDDSGEGDPFDAALRRTKQQTEKKQKKKPLGVTPKPGSRSDPAAAEVDAATAKEDEPNLFVNVVDTVSGRVLYRASHANAATCSRHIKAVVSENWIVYSFVNAKTRKTEVGVLSLYEGMIHRKGLTAFSSPEQTVEFSSWDARETKPVVLSKTYSIPKPVTALGVTMTRNGISAHQILLATTEDRIYAIGRSVLEPRRPLSDLKESEKLEGLRQYSEMIPLVTLHALTYNQTVHATTGILSAPTELESQTLVFAYGGPDLFFTRTSPSKGFDMLPESFNRILLSMLVVALLAVVVVTKRMATQKIVKHGWI